MYSAKDNFDEIVNMEELKRMTEWGADSEMIRLQKDALRLHSNKNDFEEELTRIGGCRRYLPCPICYKCSNKASHLYIKCQICRIPACVHTHREKEAMIKRENFFIPVSEDVMAAITHKGEAAVNV